MTFGGIVQLDSASSGVGGALPALGPPGTVIMWRCHHLSVAGTGRAYLYLGTAQGNNLLDAFVISQAGYPHPLHGLELWGSDGRGLVVKVTSTALTTAALWGEAVAV